MALQVTVRAFKEVPQDVRDWSRWIREAFISAISGTVDLSLVEPIATDSVLGRSTAGTGAVEVLTCTAAGRALIDDAAASNQRTTLGLGTAATQDTGTSGAKVPLLNGTNVHASGNFTALGVGTAAVQQAAIPDTTGAILLTLEAEVNKLKAVMRTFGLIAP